MVRVPITISIDTEDRKFIEENLNLKVSEAVKVFCDERRGRLDENIESNVLEERRKREAFQKQLCELRDFLEAKDRSIMAEFIERGKDGR